MQANHTSHRFRNPVHIPAGTTISSSSSSSSAQDQTFEGREGVASESAQFSLRQKLARACRGHARLSLSLFCADDLAGLFPPRTVNSAFRNVLSSVAGLFVAEVSGGLQVGYNKWVAQKRGMAQGKRRGGVGEITGRTAKLSRGRSSMVPLTQVVAPFSSLKGTRICGKEEVRSDSQGR